MLGLSGEMGEVRGGWGVKSKVKLEGSPGDAKRTERDLSSWDEEEDREEVAFGWGVCIALAVLKESLVESIRLSGVCSSEFSSEWSSSGGELWIVISS